MWSYQFLIPHLAAAATSTPIGWNLLENSSKLSVAYKITIVGNTYANTIVVPKDSGLVEQTLPYGYICIYIYTIMPIKSWNHI
jgi:hypothetical protein